MQDPFEVQLIMTKQNPGHLSFGIDMLYINKIIVWNEPEYLKRKIHQKFIFNQSMIKDIIRKIRKPSSADQLYNISSFNCTLWTQSAAYSSKVPSTMAELLWNTHSNACIFAILSLQTCYKPKQEVHDCRRVEMTENAIDKILPWLQETKSL